MRRKPLIYVKRIAELFKKNSFMFLGGDCEGKDTAMGTPRDNERASHCCSTLLVGSTLFPSNLFPNTTKN